MIINNQMHSLVVGQVVQIMTCGNRASKVAALGQTLKTPTLLGRVEAFWALLAQALKITKVTAKSRWLVTWAHICMEIIRIPVARFWALISIILKVLKLHQGTIRVWTIGIFGISLKMEIRIILWVKDPLIQVIIANQIQAVATVKLQLCQESIRLVAQVQALEAWNLSNRVNWALI